jgi:uncharacterized protein YqeY
MREQLRADLLAAMKAKDETRLKVLRGALAAIANAEAVDPRTAPKGATEVAPRELTDADVRSVLLSEQSELDAAAADLRANGRTDEAKHLEARRSILDAYL